MWPGGLKTLREENPVGSKPSRGKSRYVPGLFVDHPHQDPRVGREWIGLSSRCPSLGTGGDDATRGFRAAVNAGNTTPKSICTTYLNGHTQYKKEAINSSVKNKTKPAAT